MTNRAQDLLVFLLALVISQVLIDWPPPNWLMAVAIVCVFISGVLAGMIIENNRLGNYDR